MGELLELNSFHTRGLVLCLVYRYSCQRMQMFRFTQVVWQRPHFTKNYKITTPAGKEFDVKSGTQVIDRFWQHLRKYVKFTSRQPGNKVLTRKIRAAQYTFWYQRENMWVKTGDLITSLEGSAGV